MTRFVQICRTSALYWNRSLSTTAGRPDFFYYIRAVSLRKWWRRSCTELLTFAYEASACHRRRPQGVPCGRYVTESSNVSGQRSKSSLWWAVARKMLGVIRITGPRHDRIPSQGSSATGPIASKRSEISKQNISPISCCINTMKWQNHVLLLEVKIASIKKWDLFSSLTWSLMGWRHQNIRV